MTMTLDYDRTKVRNIDLYGEIKRDPGPHFVELSQQPPFYIEVDGLPQAVISRYDDMKKAFEDFAHFSSKKRPWAGTKGFYYYHSLPVVTDNDPPEHANLRRLMAPAFSPRKLATVEAGVRTFISDTLDKLEKSGGVFDLVDDYAHPLSTHTLFDLIFGMSAEDSQIFLNLSEAQKAAFNTLNPSGEHAERYEKAWDAARSYCEKLIEKRRKEPQDDLVSNIIAAHDVQGRITTDELFATFMVLYSAGIGGIINYTAWTLYLLAKNPGQLALLREKPELLEGAIEESLRMSPSVYVALRYATQDFDFEGLRFFEGMPVHVITSAPAYDPARHPDPLRFDITRAVNPHATMAFGHGVHHCIGAGLARMTARISVIEAVKRFPKLRLAEPDFIPDIVGVPKERGPKSIPVHTGI
jgi:cytochrome P450